jgi:hypothetical protein
MFFIRKDKQLSSLCLANMKSCVYVLIFVNKFTWLNFKKIPKDFKEEKKILYIPSSSVIVTVTGLVSLGAVLYIDVDTDDKENWVSSVK